MFSSSNRASHSMGYEYILFPYATLVTEMLHFHRDFMFCSVLFIYLFIYFFFDLGFTALSRIFHLYRADRLSKVGKNRRTRGKTT